MMTPANLEQRSRMLVLIQALLGLVTYVVFALPYLRCAPGLARLRPGQRYLFVVNHVSLLDTILLGALCWRSGCYPILVLGDREVWHASWIRRLLSSRIGFLLQRGRLNPGRLRELQTFGRAAARFNLVVFPEGTRGDGVKVGPWRLQHVVPDFTFSDHPTYGAMSIAHWVCKDGQPWKVGAGLFLARGNGKPRDLEIKVAALDMTPQVIDHLILLRHDDDISLSGKSKTIWQDSERKGNVVIMP